MSDETPQNLPTQSGRERSVRLREAAPSARGDRLDTANKSLEDALRLTFRLVQVAMVVLVVLFLGSGLRTVQEGQVGIATRFGAIARQNLEPGAHFTWPYPAGELVTIGTGSEELRINREFFPHVPEGQENRPESELGSRGTLNPARDGSLITADQNIAHSQWTVSYRRADAGQYAQTIPPDLEREFVRRAVRQGIVRAVAETTIDDLLKDSDVGAHARVYAQEQLRLIGTGIEIDQLTLNRKFAPTQLLEQFSKVQSAVSIASEARVTARRMADGILNMVAGEGAAALVAEIDAYERAVELGRDDEARGLLARIDAMLVGEPVEIDGRAVTPNVSGEVAQILSDAQQRAISVASKARQDVERFRALRAQRQANAPLMLTGEWAEAMAAFHARPSVQTFVLPRGGGDSVQVRLNPDPSIIRQLDVEQKRQEAEETARQREAERQRARFSTQRGVQRDEGM